MFPRLMKVWKETFWVYISGNLRGHRGNGAGSRLPLLCGVGLCQGID